MISFSRNKQLVIYAILAIFGVAFFIYFFRQAAIVEFIEPKVRSGAASTKKIIGDVNINSEFFESDKFRNLRFDSLPAVSFPVGKRNPFEPY
jgi:hypothetical protein